MTEWRMIPGFERYEVSDDGRVRYAATQRERKLHVTRQGYNYVSMHVGPPTEREIGKRNKPRTCKVHRLVALTFIPNPDDLAEVNHKDFCRTNNRVDNLEWASKRSNVDHALANGHYDPAVHPRRLKRLSLDDVAAIRASTDHRTVLAERFGVNPSHISKIRSGYAYRSTSPVKYTGPKSKRKLSQEKADALRALHAGGASATECAATFGIGTSMATKIIKGKSWSSRTQGETTP